MKSKTLIKTFKSALLASMLAVVPLTAKASEPIYRYYSVIGTDFKSVNASMMANRPNGANSGNEWHIGWKFTFQEYDGQCHLIKPSVSKKTIIILPRWDNISDGKSNMQKEWKRYSKALKVHQHGHIKNANQAQEAILSMLKSFPAMEKCRDVKSLANKQARAILKEYYKKDAAYEKETEKGATQGAQLKEP